MRTVPRHRFIPEAYRAHAYEDRPLPIGEGQTISQPYMVAVMTELLELEPDDRVLEIGTGSGYQAAVLGELAAEVYTIEIVESLARRAARDLEKLGYENIHARHGASPPRFHFHSGRGDPFGVELTPTSLLDLLPFRRLSGSPGPVGFFSHPGHAMLVFCTRADVWICSPEAD